MVSCAIYRANQPGISKGGLIMDELRKIIFSLECQVKAMQARVAELEDRIEVLEGDGE